jgi:hypothetical protein
MMKFEKYVVWGSTTAVTGTGVVYGWMKHLMHPSDPFAVVNHSLQPLVLKLHIVSAPVLVFGIGMILMRHIWPHFRNGLRRGRRSGILSALITLPMIATGYALQASASVGWLKAIGYVHLGLGLVFGFAALAHALATRARRSASSMDAAPQPISSGRAGVWSP